MFPTLKNKGFLGMNARNLLFIKPYNYRNAIDLANDKLASKRKFIRKKIPTPGLCCVFENKADLDAFDWKKLPNSFVIKPQRGYGGEGILVIYGKRKDTWVKPNREDISLDEIKLHILDILDGTYSLANIPDSAFIEQKLKIYPGFKRYVYRGVPDIRIIVFNKIPVMAMLRLPTERSAGRANLHSGAIGVGIEIATGITTHGYLNQAPINKIPGTRYKLNGIKIPFWTDILNLAVRTQEVTKIGFLGVDIVIDKDNGPMVLELNAHPGLEIQNVNLIPLRSRLELVRPLKIKDIEKGVRVAKELFAEDTVRDIEGISGKKVIGRLERVKIIYKGKKKYPVIAKIDTGAWRTTICQSMKDRLGLDKMIKQKKVRSVFGKENREIIELNFIIRGRLHKTQAFVTDRRSMGYNMIVGRRDLQNYFINPSKVDPEIVKRKLKKQRELNRK
jgi:alpha-L-glutamate ligase-like protein